MRAAVASNFKSFNEQFEGWLPHMYLDEEGLVTTGMGNLIDPVSAALPLPWKNRDGSAATAAEITSEWQLVKSHTELERGGGAAGFGAITQLRLSEADIDALVQSKMLAFEGVLRGFFPGWDNFGADAQMGILSMAWAMGPDFPKDFPKFTAAVNAGDWATAKAESQMKPTPGIAPRNAADLILFDNAGVDGADPETLFYPNAATPGGILGGAGGGIFAGIMVLALLGLAGWGVYKLHKGVA